LLLRRDDGALQFDDRRVELLEITKIEQGLRDILEVRKTGN
jgi:hypothetical protein